jgi:uncharacterized protein (TIGR03790 family)
MMLFPRFPLLASLVLALLLPTLAGAAPKATRVATPAPADDQPNGYAAATLVVYNTADRDSTELAHYYAQRRAIPKDQVIGLKCAKTEEITRAEYERTIAEPLRQIFNAHGWWKLREASSPLGPVESNRIRFVALIRGIPLKIAEAPGYPGDKSPGPGPVGAVNAAAVDSELSILGYHMKIISGAVPNPYYRGFSTIADAHHPAMMLVCRLDAPSAETVRGMIDDSLAAEEHGLTGFAYVDARNIKEAGYLEGDTWLYTLANSARRHGTPVVLDNGPGLFPEGYPMNQAALYFGWYAEHVTGPFVRPDFRFARGAVAVHIHSFSAATLRDPLHHWVGPLVSAGAVATFGNVYEPYLTLTPQLDIFYDRLRQGFTFAESAYMAQRALSWMTTFVGDPLYRPYKGTAELEEKPNSGEWADFREVGRAWFSADRAKGDEALRELAKKYHSGMIMEALGLLQLSVNDRDAAMASFEQARDYYGGKSDDAIRVAIHEIIQLESVNHIAEAKTLGEKMIAASPHSTAVDLLRALVETRIAPIATPAPASVSAKH